MNRLIFIDVETTGLNHEIHDVWEIAAIVRDDDGDREVHWWVKPDLTHADPQALRIGRYYERTVGVMWDYKPEVALHLARLLDDSVVIGSNPAFDERFLTRWLRSNGQVWAAHYRTIDVTTLGWGYIIGGQVDFDNASYVPPRSHAISSLLGVEPHDYDRHTALGDARMVRDLYDAITGGAR